MLDNNQKLGKHRVVITGLGVVSALGCCINDFWTKLLAGMSGIDNLTNIDLSQHCRTRIGGQVTDYNPRDHFSSKELNRLSRCTQLALVAASEAVQDANLQGNDHIAEKAGIILGGAIGGFVASEPFFQTFFETGKASPFTLPMSMTSAPASHVSLRFGFKGPLMTVDAACASSAHAIGYAFNMIRFGILDVALTGGADTPFSPGVVQAWSDLHVLTARNDTPKDACRPFSQDRDGTVLGEGAGILILESERSALERKATIYAEVTGYAATSDSYHITQPFLQGSSEAMRLALVDARLASEQIDYINAHASATPVNDKLETAAIKNVFGSRAYEIPVVGIKAALGHTIAASGALELISCSLSIRDSIIPPTINLKVPDPDCDLDYVKEGKRACNIRHALSNSFAFGGSNATIAISRYIS